MNVEPFLFDDMKGDDLDESETEELAPPSVPVYTTQIEQAVFDIMEEVDAFFRSSVTVEEYDGVQKKVKGILLEAFDDKKTNSTCSRNRPLLIVLHDQD